MVYLKILVNTSINCKPLKFTTSCNIKDYKMQSDCSKTIKICKH